MSDDKVEMFLEQEAAASKLVEELGELRRETESYSAARGALSEAGTQLATLVAREEELAEGTRAIIVKLQEIGGPQLLQDHVEIREQLTLVQQELAKTKTFITVVMALVVVFGVAGILAAFVA